MRLQQLVIPFIHGATSPVPWVSTRDLHRLVKQALSVMLMSMMCFSAPNLGYAETPPESAAVITSADLQAAFVYNIMLFARWPSLKMGRTLCTAGQNRDSLSLKKLDKRELKEGEIHIKPIVTEAELSSCDALFIASLDYIHLSDHAQQKPILVFSNLRPDYADNIAIIIGNTGGKVVFDVHLAGLQRSHIRLSSSVLQLARSVQ